MSIDPRTRGDVPETMRAAVYHRYGPPEVLTVAHVRPPRTTSRTVLVRVAATSVNGGELLARSGRVRAITALSPGFPKRIGLDFAGVVEAVGADVEEHRPGAAVWGLARGRLEAAAELITVPPGHLGPAPGGLDLRMAAALPAVGTTAITALQDVAVLCSGERVLVRGAAGGVGSVAVQLAHGTGAHVTALTGAASTELLHSLGAHEVVDHRTTAPKELGPFDVVLDTVGTQLKGFRRLLAPGGRMVTVALDPNRILTTLAYILSTARHGTGRVRFFSGRPRRPLLDRLAALVDNGTIRPVVHETFPLQDIASAHARLERRGVTGKLVVTT